MSGHRELAEAFVDILNAADGAHYRLLADLFEAGALTGDQWDEARRVWEGEHIPAIYRYDPRRVTS